MGRAESATFNYTTRDAILYALGGELLVRQNELGCGGDEHHTISLWF